MLLTRFYQTTLSRRLTMHGQKGSIFRHFIDIHKTKPTREQLTQNTKIIAKANDRYKLAIKEALLILKHSPSINIQFDNFTNILKLHDHRNPHTQATPVEIDHIPPPPPIPTPDLPFPSFPIDPFSLPHVQNPLSPPYLQDPLAIPQSPSFPTYVSPIFLPPP